ncbi:MAG: tetratricopeptide repeat protein, partial [Candidatus Aminicenantes bacterium]|nr:tetratricopeptide repeat protein [Candidatus Aminicenantes bacterium]
MTKHWINRSLLTLLIIAAFTTHCTMKRKTLEIEQINHQEEMLITADQAYQTGSYYNLKKAEAIYTKMASEEPSSLQIHEKLIKTLLLLALRSKELGLPSAYFEKKAQQLFTSMPSLSAIDRYFPVVLATQSNLPGASPQQSIEDHISLTRHLNWIRKNADPINDELKIKAVQDTFFAYLLLSFHENFNPWIKEKLDVDTIKKVHPDSPIIQYKLALVPKIDDDRLKEMLLEYPDFHEMHFFLGGCFLASGEILTAENHYKQMLQYFPDCTTCLMGLSRINFALEEYQECIGIYDKVLSLLPTFQDVYLGKIICLSYLGKHHEALAICQENQERKDYLMGEFSYWSAWNLQQLGLYDQAVPKIEKAQKYLYRNYEVLLLSGLIYFGLKDYEHAEKDLADVLVHTLDLEAAFHLGKIYA